MVEAFADAARRANLTLAPSRMAAVGKLHGVDVRAELAQSHERGRDAMRCVASLSPPLGLGLVARTADDREPVRPSSPAALEVKAPEALTALALHLDVAEALLAGPVGDVLCMMVQSGFEPRLRDATAEVWVLEPADADRLLAAITTTAELAWLAVEERKKLPVPERVRVLEVALTAAADELDVPVVRSADAFDIRLEHGSIRVRLEREGTRAITVLDLALDHAAPARADHPLTQLRALAAVESARVTEDGVAVEIGHVSAGAAELGSVIAALDQLADDWSRPDKRGPYR